MCYCLAALSTCGGCQGEDYPIAPVSGVITLDGKPLEGATIGFEPDLNGRDINAGPGSYGHTDAEGHYQLEALTGELGAVVGSHSVWVRTYQGPGDRSLGAKVIARERIPPQYNSNTTLTFTVPPEGTEQADFELKSRP